MTRKSKFIGVDKSPQIGLRKTSHIVIGIIIGILIYCILIYGLVWSEKTSPQSSLTNLTNAFWYSIVTLTTVGYGDIYPTTVYGRFIGYIFVLLSLGIYGLFIGQFTTLIATFKENKKMGLNGTNFRNHAIILGWNDYGQLVTDQLVGVGKQIAIITENKDHIEFIKDKYNSDSIYVLYADLKNYDMLKKANITESDTVFVNLDDDTDKLVYILNLRKIFPNLDFVVTLDNGDLKNTFISAGVTNTISKHEISSKLLASYMFEPDVASFSESIMSYADSDTDYDMKQFLIVEQNPFVNKQYHEVFFELKRKYNSVLIGITKRDKYGKRRLLKNPMGELRIAPGDYLLILMNGKAYKIIKKIFIVDEGFFKEGAPK